MPPASAFLQRQNNALARKRQAMANLEKGDRFDRKAIKRG
jgi:hypothetical protein